MAEPTFVAVSTNAAIDRVAQVEGLGRLERASRFLETAGGKAIHAACVAAELGAAAVVVTTAGGRNGDLMLELLHDEPLDVIPVPVAGATRGTYTLVGTPGGELIEVHEPAAPMNEAEADALVSALDCLPTAPRVVAVCGSLPPAAPTDLHARLIEKAKELGAFTILDCSTPEALAAGLAAGPDLVAPNAAEAGALLGSRSDITSAIMQLGAAAVWLTLGPEGSVFAGAEGSFRLTAPQPQLVVNTVGCGDALIGGFAAGLIRGLDPLRAAALGVAAATDKLSRLHPGRVERGAVEALLPAIQATPLRAGAPVS
jgi:1-phosphofructokinase family hexose kinase